MTVHLIMVVMIVLHSAHCRFEGVYFDLPSPLTNPKSTADVNMSESWLQSWLVGLNLSEYLDPLSQHGYTTAKGLASIVERDQLKAIGVTKMGHLNRLFRAIEKLRSNGDVAEDSGVPSVPPSLENHNSAPGELECHQYQSPHNYHTYDNRRETIHWFHLILNAP